MSSSLLLDRTASHIVTLTFNRPEARNALNWEAQKLFLETVRQLINDPLVRVVILTGAGEKAFCAGGDLVELATYAQASDGAQLAAIMGEALSLLETAPFPTIAALNGHALGGGAEIALGCDLRMMSHQAHIGFVQLSLGLTPGWGAGQRLVRVVGYSRAMALLLQATPLNSEEALQLGLVNEIAPQGTVLERALQFAERIANWDQAAVAAVKRILRYPFSLPYGEAHAAEQAEFPSLWASEAHLQAVEAFLKRRGK